MARRIRKTPVEEEERVAERIYNEFREDIGNRDEFEKSFSRLIETSKKDMTVSQLEFMDSAFKKYVDKYALPIAEKRLKKEGRIERAAIEARRLTIPAKIKGKVVFSQEIKIKIRGREYIKFRDRKGRFASVK